MSEEATMSKKREFDEEDKENEGEVMSLQDAIDNEMERCEMASAVLGASDATNCSYDEGYVYRQALYGCITCYNENKASKMSDESEILHGICLACSYECHPNHELYELYTKRNFRCDCGNSKFTIDGKSQACKLKPNKEGLNVLNNYNHNFKGQYCICNRPYPEVNDSSTELNQEENSDEMIQCSICEDWYHTNHLLGNHNLPTNEADYDEMICHICMSKNNFLWYYQDFIATKSSSNESENFEVDVLNDETTPGCFLKKFKIKLQDLELKNEACCYLSGWRDTLCKCAECLELYHENKIDFLINSKDTIKFYEECGKQKNEMNEVDENKLLNAELSKMNHVSKIEFLHNVNDFKEELKGFLTDFAKNGQVVKRENVLEFFENLNTRKKRKVDNLNYF